jgi:hypothetical protein
MSVSNLALLLYERGDYGAAEPLFRRVLEARERVLGAEHAQSNLAAVESIRNLRIGGGVWGGNRAGKTTYQVSRAPGTSPEPSGAGTQGVPEVPTSRIDKVHFAVAAPPAVRPGSSFIVDLWAHLERQRSEVERRIRQSVAQTDPSPVIRQKGPFAIARGATLYVRLEFSDLLIESPEDVILWDGEIGNASFAVAVPHEASEGPKSGWITVHWEGCFQIARVPLRIQVAPEPGSAVPIAHPLDRIHKAFASYASADRDEVLHRIQGMQKIVPDLEVFLDVVKLRSGDDWEAGLWRVIPDQDVFYLFWSRNAKQSPWVEKEWRCALKTRGLAFIDPVPLESPDVVEPPEELKKKHFNDWVLAYQRSKDRPTA